MQCLRWCNTARMCCRRLRRPWGARFGCCGKKLEDAEPVDAMVRQNPSALTAHGRVHMKSKSSFFEIRKWNKIVCRQLC
jgi:hypothetical protein